MQDMQPVASLRIPNKFYVLSDRKNCLEEIVGTSVSKHLEMANSIIEAGGVKIRSNATTVEERLKRESRRFLRMYRDPKKGGTYRKNLLMRYTNMLLFKGETEEQVATNDTHISQLHFTGRPFETLSDRQQRRRKVEIKDALTTICSGMTDIGLSLTSIQLETTESHETVSIAVQPPQHSNDSNDNDDSNTDNFIPDMAYLMLKYGVSFEYYHELCARFKDLPRAYKVQQFKNSMAIPSVVSTPGRSEGSQFDFNEIFVQRLEQEIKEYSTYYASEKRIRVKVSGDGAEYSRSSTFCLLTFSIIRNGSVNLSSTNLHGVAAIRAAEKYQILAEEFKDVCDAVNSYIQHPTITINDVEYTLEFFLCADYKFLLVFMGFKNATAKHSCIWCTVQKADRYDMTITHDKRTRAQLTGNGKLGSINAPLLDLELDHVIPDELHLMLRVVDVLIEALVCAATAYDNHQHTLSRSRRAFKAINGPMLNNLVMAIKKCGVHFYLYEEEDGSMKWPSLLGPDKMKLLKKLSNEFTYCQPTEMVKDVQKLWEDFDAIYNTLSSRARAPSCSHDLHQRGKDWVNLFVKIGNPTTDTGYCYGDGYRTSKVTPYMHILVFHVPTFMDKYGNIKQFSCQGVEQKNSVAKGLYHRSSNKWDATTDILINDYKLHELKNCERPKRKYTKHDELYWTGGGIEETRKKRRRISHDNTDNE